MCKNFYAHEPFRGGMSRLRRQQAFATVRHAREETKREDQ
jgi:hypothetical protein